MRREKIRRCVRRQCRADLRMPDVLSRRSETTDVRREQRRGRDQHDSSVHGGYLLTVVTLTSVSMSLALGLRAAPLRLRRC